MFSPSPRTLTTVPVPHFLWMALSPVVHPSLSPPEALYAGRLTAARVVLGTARLVVLFLPVAADCFKVTCSKMSSDISAINR